MDMLSPFLDKKAMDILTPFLDKKAMDILTPVFQLTKNVMEEEEEYEVLQTDLTPINNLLVDIGTLFTDQRKEDQEILKIWLQLLRNCLTDGCNLLHRYGPSQRQRRLDFVNCRPGTLLKRLKEWKLHFDYIFQGLQSDLSMFVTAHQIINTDPTPALRAELSGVLTRSAELEEVSGDRTLSAEESVDNDEAWMVFERIAFREKGAPVDIEGCARSIAEECKGFPLAIRLVAAAMRGKTTVDEWNISLSSIKNQGQQPSSSYPHTLHPQLYPLLRWCYDALPNSHIKNCFLYSAMYPKGTYINVQELVRMWIGEGLVRSKQENHSMDMAIGRRYLNLLLDRCFFQNASPAEKIWDSNWKLRGFQRIRVEDKIHEMAIYIGEEENLLLKAEDQRLQNFPTIHNHADCERISLFDNYGIENLPSELPCPKLVSFILSCNSIEKVPSGFLVSLTSLKVLNLQDHYPWNSRINSIPSSVGQLKQLEFLRLRGLHMKKLPEEMCHLPLLQILDLSSCVFLESLPSKIGELQKLKYLNLWDCCSLTVIPHGFSQLTSLTALDLGDVRLSVKADQSEARSIWRLKGFTNLRELTLSVHGEVAEGIMGTWLDMRHLCFKKATNLPRDMKEMRKLQSFELHDYKGSSLPDYACNFRHLENICLLHCNNLREVSPLGRLPSLKCLTLYECYGLKELGIGSSGRASRFLMLQKLVLWGSYRLKSIAGASSSNESVWNENTLPSLRILKIHGCPNLERFPVGMDRLVNMNTISGEQEWWDQIIWEDDAMKAHLQKLFQRW